MNRIILCLIGIGSFLVGLTPLSPLAAGPIDDPILSQTLAKKLKSLPFSITGRPALVLRQRHVRSVQFLGAGVQSKYGFVRRVGIMPRGLWVRLKNNGSEGWAQGSIVFDEPLDARRYNSLVLWVRSDWPGLRLWAGFQDANWNFPGVTQSRSDVFPPNGLPKNKIVQVMVPYATVMTENPVDFEALERIHFEFGHDTVGNARSATIEILGMALVEQRYEYTRMRILPATYKRKRVVQKVVPPPPEPVKESKPVEVPSVKKNKLLGSGSTVSYRLLWMIGRKSVV